VEAVGQVGGAIELTAADVDLAFGRLAEGNDARVEAMDQRAERDEIQRAFGVAPRGLCGVDVKSVFHKFSFLYHVIARV
jgi:hypothetical protein